MLLPPLRPLPPPADLSQTLVELRQSIVHSFQQDSDLDDKNYTLQWLTRVVSATATGEEEWEDVATEAGACLALLAGDKASQTALDRRYSFDSPVGGIEVTIRDAADMSYSSIGAQTWNAAPLLARRICANPSQFFPALFSPKPPLALTGLETPPYTRPSTPVKKPYRILELGSGTGLVGIATAGLLARLNQDVEIVLTDYHPAVLENLQHNVDANDFGAVSVCIAALDWRDPSSSSVGGRFDAIIGSDVVYEPVHAHLVADMVKRFLRLPPLAPVVLAPTPRRPIWPLTPEPSRPGSPTLSQSMPTTPFHMMLPLRPTFVAEQQAVAEAFGGPAASTDTTGPSTHDSSWQDVERVAMTPSDGVEGRLKVFRSELSTSEARSGQGVSDYRYLCISWA